MSNLSADSNDLFCTDRVEDYQAFNNIELENNDESGNILSIVLTQNVL